MDILLIRSSAEGTGAGATTAWAPLEWDMARTSASLFESLLGANCFSAQIDCGSCRAPHRLASQPDGNPSISHYLLGLANRVLAKMENACRQGGIGFAEQHGISQMLGPPRPPTGDHRD